MYINNNETIKKISKKWNVTEEYLPWTLLINIKNNDIKSINFIYSSDFLVSDDDNQYNKEFLEKILGYIDDEKNIVDSKKRYLMLNDGDIDSIRLYVCEKKDYYSTNKIHAYGAYIWPIDLKEVNK